MIDDINAAAIPGYGPFNAMSVSGREFLVGKQKPFIKLTKQTANMVVNISGKPRLTTMLREMLRGLSCCCRDYLPIVGFLHEQGGLPGNEI